MNQFDKKLFKTLNFFANNSLGSINTMSKENLVQYTNQYAFEEGYIDADERREYGITAKGLEQLRTLEGIKHNQKTFWVSITALTISIITFIISLYFKGGN